MLQGKKGNVPRRPLVLLPDSSEILKSIRDNLSTTTGIRQQSTGGVRDSPDYGLQHRHDSVSSGGTPSLSKPNGSIQGKKKNSYNSKALDEIRKTLHPYKTDSGAVGLESPENSEVNKTVHQSTMGQGQEEDKSLQALKAANNKNLDSAAFEALYNIQIEGKNGITKNVYRRKNSLGTASPGSDSASTRSESPIVSSVNSYSRAGHQPAEIQSVVTTPGTPARVLSPMNVPIMNGTQTPPPVPPRHPLVSNQQTPTLGQSPHGSDSSYVMSSTNITPTSVHSHSTPNHISSQNMKIMAGISPRMSPFMEGTLVQSSVPNIQQVNSSPVMPLTGVNPVQISQNIPVESGNTRSVQLRQSPNPNSVTIKYQQRPPPPPYHQGQGQPQRPGTQTVIIQSGRAGEQSQIYQQNVRAAPTYEIQVSTSPMHRQIPDAIQISVSQPGQQRKPVSARAAPQQQIIMQKVISREVTKPQLQTATAPISSLPVNQNLSGLKYVSSVETTVNGSQPQPQAPHPKGQVQIQITGGPQHNNGHFMNGRLTPDQYHQYQNQRPSQPLIKIHVEGNQQQYYHSSANILDHMYNDTPLSTPRSGSPISLPRHANQSPLSISSNPSTSSDIPDRPPPPYPGPGRPLQLTKSLPQGNPVQIVQPIPQNPMSMGYQIVHSHPASVISGKATAPTSSMLQQHQPPLPPRVPITQPQGKPPPPPPPSSQANESQPPVPPKGFLTSLPPKTLNTDNAGPSPNGPPSVEQSEVDTDNESLSTTSDISATQDTKRTCTSPIPERKPESEEKDILRRDTLVRNYSPQAYKFYMEQHIENLMKNYKQRQTRRLQLEREMAKARLSEEAQHQMRRMLQQKESNYIRMKRSKMNKDMFEKIKTLGIGAFGEVTLVRKRDVYQLYAMKTLRKSEVLKRNQVAHVKAERDILAEADNEWVVKLYYSFQDRDNLYFVMDYVPGGDLMGLLIKFGIFEEKLARFYIAELVLAIESVHKMGFIHRDIKPDNILIDKDGHIKLTDFGLCTGFRWTHNSKYYQKDGVHPRQDSMDINCSESPMSTECECRKAKPLERRKHRERLRCLAHSLVGTPNYIAPEVLLRQGYTSCCDWWSVGVILYEMLVGQPPFYAQTPQETQYKVINWEKTLNIPVEAKLSQSSIDLILRLCCGAENRLGKKGADEIKNHLFFSSTQFEGLRKQPALYVPKIRHVMDTSNFDPVEERSDDSDSDNEIRNIDHPVNGKHPEHAFFEFTFRRFFDDGGHPYPSVRHVEHVEPEKDDAETSSSESNLPVYV